MLVPTAAPGIRSAMDLADVFPTQRNSIERKPGVPDDGIRLMNCRFLSFGHSLPNYFMNARFNIERNILLQQRNASAPFQDYLAIIRLNLS